MAKQRVGYALGYGKFTNVREMAEVMKQAEEAATLDELTGGRMTVAPGACTKSHARVHALPQDVGATPTEVLREYIDSMRLLFTGEKVSYHGKFVNFDNVGLGWKPIRAHIPLYVPATATVGLRLADEIGDGVVLNVVCSPEYTVNALKIIKESAEKAGRDFSKLEVAQIINCSVEDDHTKALD